MSKWIDFKEAPKPETRKTNIYNVWTTGNGFLLGRVMWYSPWRCYSFFPEPNTVFEKTCLTDIHNFIKSLMDERRKNICTPVIPAPTTSKIQ